jgi:hypothetical protein
VSGHHGTAVQVQVTGIPAGKQVRLTATTSNGDLHHHQGSCRRAGKGYTCTATRPRNQFLFSVNSSSGPTLTFSVTPPEGYTDPSQGNNSVSVQVPSKNGKAHRRAG